MRTMIHIFVFSTLKVQLTRAIAELEHHGGNITEKKPDAYRAREKRFSDHGG